MLAPAPQRETPHAKTTLLGWCARHAAFFLVFAISAWYAGENLNRGWIRHDDGALAQMAERVLHGELPHRDFADIYTGALDYPHALAFKFFGTTLTSLRLVLFAAFLGWLPVVYRVALFSGPPWVAAAVTFLAAAWSIPNYSASMPSWYNLFLATGAALCLLQSADRQSKRMRWLFFAGLCCGLSILIKITGMYALAAALLGCVYLQAPGGERQAANNRGYALFVVVCLLAFLAVVFRVLGARGDLNETFAFLLPCALLSYVLVRRAALSGGPNGLEPFLPLAKTVAPLLLGTLVPIALFLIPYLWSHSVRALYNGTMVAPFRRVNVTVVPSTEILRTWPAVVLIGLLLIAAYYRLSRSVQMLIAATGVCFLFITADSVLVLQALWHSIFDVVPYLVLAVALWMIVAYTETGKSHRFFVLLAFAVCCNLTRFPFSGPIYFCYVAPLVFLTIQAWLEQMPQRSPAVLLAVLAFFLAFDVMRIKPPFLVEMGAEYLPDEDIVPFTIERARGIRTRIEVVGDFEEIVKLVHEHSKSKTIYAGPDAPEVYFLTGSRNPTRDLFDFLNENAVGDANAALDRGDINVVVWSRGPQFSHGKTGELQKRIEREFPHAKRVYAFDVRWR